MTGIVVDKFKDSLYVFADGRVTEDDFVFTDHDDKITKLDDENIMTMCGEAIIIDQCMDLFLEGKLDNEHVRKINGEGTVIWISTENIKTVDIDNKAISLYDKDKKRRADDADKVSINNNGISTYKHQCLPMFFGSGKRSLSGAYYALECHKSADEKTYISRMRKAFKAASTLVASMGPLKQVESIKLTKDKTK